ncbi:PepSY-associated TM helix domain-containing protein [Echinimonas agarilytica]|uniref:PepSY domain-containing protein n=1 Tax=Echinimonas agarilytica TaxID=1215918 RepID=A0AA42B7G4_9GAMM|nr:PepSY-associated TM helix domain-containing protein [Echinimonas agarilytica]MCM2679253.1 PepSY domain-containing protein [Echinimonas agarilytica]
MSIKKTLFWAHLVLGCSAALFIFLMSISGVALTYERQMIQAAQRADYPVAPSTQSQPLEMDEVVDFIENYHFKKTPQIQISHEQSAPVVLKDGRRTVAYLNPYTGEKLDSLGEGTVTFFKKLRAFHRWLTFDGSFSETGSWVNGISNAFFLVLVISGIYLWFPQRFKARAFKQKLTLNGRYANSKARNYQWHNVFGLYMAPILFVVVFTALFFSFKWPGEALKNFATSESPLFPSQLVLQELNVDTALPLAQQLDAVKQAFPQWQTIQFSLSNRNEGVSVYQVDYGNGGEPQKRFSVALNTSNANVLETQSFEQLSDYRKVRSYIRFLHTGEIYGLVGQTLAGIASLLACLLVYTGIMLSWTRWKNSRKKRD